MAVDAGDLPPKLRAGCCSRTPATKRSPSAFDKVSSGVVLLNGSLILRPRDFHQTVEVVERPIVLWKKNVVIVALAAKPGAGVTLEILGERVDMQPPEIHVSG